MLLFNTVSHNSLTPRSFSSPSGFQDFHSWHIAIVNKKRRVSGIRFPKVAGDGGVGWGGE